MMRFMQSFRYVGIIPKNTDFESVKKQKSFFFFLIVLSLSREMEWVQQSCDCKDGSVQNGSQIHFQQEPWKTDSELEESIRGKGL